MIEVQLNNVEQRLIQLIQEFKTLKKRLKYLEDKVKVEIGQMATKTKIGIGVLLLILLSTGIVYVEWKNDARIRVDNDKSTFYVPHEDYFWIWTVSGREYNKLMDGTSNMNRDVSNIFVEEIFRNETGQFYFRDGEFVDNSLLYPNLELEIGESQIGRKTPYIRGPVIIDTYYFDGTIDDIELFPISHTVEIINGSGKYYRYKVVGKLLLWRKA